MKEEAISKAQWSLYGDGVLEIQESECRRVNLIRAIKIDDDTVVTEHLSQRVTRCAWVSFRNRSLVMHHVSSCNQCGKSPK